MGTEQQEPSLGALSLPNAVREPARARVLAVLRPAFAVVELAVLFLLVTTAVEALVAQGLNLVALAVGTLVPGQFGVSDGAFALSARAFGTTTAKAMSIALLAHAIQVLFVLLGSLTPLVWKARAPRPHALSVRAAKGG